MNPYKTIRSIVSTILDSIDYIIAVFESYIGIVLPYILPILVYILYQTNIQTSSLGIFAFSVLPLMTICFILLKAAQISLATEQAYSSCLPITLKASLFSLLSFTGRLGFYASAFSNIDGTKQERLRSMSRLWIYNLAGFLCTLLLSISRSAWAVLFFAITLYSVHRKQASLFLASHAIFLVSYTMLAVIFHSITGTMSVDIYFSLLKGTILAKIASIPLDFISIEIMLDTFLMDTKTTTIIEMTNWYRLFGPVIMAGIGALYQLNKTYISNKG